MKILIACEYSGVVREAFKKKGHYAVSCDLELTDIPGDHIMDDVLNHLKGWDMMIAHLKAFRELHNKEYFDKKIKGINKIIDKLDEKANEEKR